jgi:hypothetical protein
MVELVDDIDQLLMRLDSMEAAWVADIDAAHDRWDDEDENGGW